MFVSRLCVSGKVSVSVTVRVWPYYWKLRRNVRRNEKDGAERTVRLSRTVPPVLPEICTVVQLRLHGPGGKGFLSLHL